MIGTVLLIIKTAMKFTTNLFSPILTTYFILSWQIVVGQFNEHKNDVYVTGGTVPGEYIVGTINYERWILNFNHNKKTYLTVKMGYGIWSDMGGEGRLGTLGCNFLYGRYNNFFDLGFGAALFTDSVDDPYNWVNPGFNIGYRYRSNHLVLRTGVSWPEALYLSLGFSF